MGNNISTKRELQLVAYAITLVQEKNNNIVPASTNSQVFPIIFLNTKRLR